MLFLYFVIQNNRAFFISLYKGVVGFLPVPTCKTLTFKSLSMLYNSFSYLEHNHIKEQKLIKCLNKFRVDNIYREGV